MTGAPAERVQADALVRAVGSDRCISIAGRTTLRELLAAYTLADVLVTNDSGPAHFATLTPVDVVTLFGPEHPDLFAARSPRNHVLWEGLPCSPCVSAYNDRTSPCRDNVCLQRISVDRVLAIVLDVLERRRPHRHHGLRSLAIPGSRS
jgi:ADP-heptose:LPS heptosyltransferase